MRVASSDQYVELHARSAFSFLRGAATPEELIAVCYELNMPAMALLDNDGVYGSARFPLAAKKIGIQAHIGAGLPVQIPKSKFPIQKCQAPSPPAKVQSPKSSAQSPTNNTFVLPLLVRNRTGYQNLCRLITLMKLRVPKHAKPGECAITCDELATHAEGLVCLTGTEEGPLATHLHHKGHRDAQQIGEKLIDIFGRENVYAEVKRHFNRA